MKYVNDLVIHHASILIKLLVKYAFEIVKLTNQMGAASLFTIQLAHIKELEMLRLL